jgi:hypothetical protein
MRIATQRFDVLVTDLHMPDPGDGFAELTAMPFEVKQLTGLMDKKRLTSKPSPNPAKEGVTSFLDRDLTILMQPLLAQVEVGGNWLPFRCPRKSPHIFQR